MYFALLLIITTFFVGCTTSEEVPEEMISRDLFHYASGMRFEFRPVEEGEFSDSWASVMLRIWNTSPNFDPFYDELVFVHSEEEAQSFPDNVIVAWPSEVTGRIVEAINVIAARDESDLGSSGRMREVINLADFPLDFPITTADLVDNWEQVDKLWGLFTSTEQSSAQAFGASNQMVFGQADPETEE